MKEHTKPTCENFDRVEVTPPRLNGLAVLVVNIVLNIAALALLIWMMTHAGKTPTSGDMCILFSCIIYMGLVSPLLIIGLKVVRPNEAVVLTLFGKYHGTLRKDGFYYVNPFCTMVAPPSGTAVSGTVSAEPPKANAAPVNTPFALMHLFRKRISLKSMTLNNERQKVNDSLGNPIIIGIVVIWRVENTAKALFNVDNYVEFLSTQCDSSLRNIVRMYPYDASDDKNAAETSLRGSSQEIADKLKGEIQGKVAIAGLEIQEARITHLAYAPEIAAAMLQRQQATAIVAARQLIVDGAVGMVELALNKLKENAVVELDEERKAAMVSNLLVVLCSNKDTQPVVNSGSLY